MGNTTIINAGNGNVINKSKNINIVQNNENQQEAQLSKQLQTLLQEYQRNNPDDTQGIRDIANAHAFVQKNPGKSPDDILSSLSGKAIKLAKELSLGVLVNAITKALGI